MEGSDIESVASDRMVIVRWLKLAHLDDADVLGLARVLDSSESERAARFHFDRDRRAYIAAHALLRILLSRKSSRLPASWRFVTGPHGKPEIDPEAGVSSLRFNISHTHGLVAAALTRGCDVGIDVERVDPRRLGPDVTERFFARAETAHLRSLEGSARCEAAYAYWTLKEAYLKAIGLGLTCPLDAFHFALDPLAVSFSARLDDDPSQWLIRRLRPTPEHALALMVRHARPSDLVLDARELRVEELELGRQSAPGSGRI